MNQNFTEALELLDQQLGRDTVLTLATCADNQPVVRNVDLYYKDEAFYLCTYRGSVKMNHMEQNPKVAIGRGFVPGLNFAQALFQANGVATILGHPLEPQNRDLREMLMEVFSAFYEKDVDEGNPDQRYVRIDLTSCVVFSDRCKYVVDFAGKTAEKYEMPQAE